MRRSGLEIWCQQRADEVISANGWKVEDEDRLKIAKAISAGTCATSRRANRTPGLRLAIQVILRSIFGNPLGLLFNATTDINWELTASAANPIKFHDSVELNGSLKTFELESEVISSTG